MAVEPCTKRCANYDTPGLAFGGACLRGRRVAESRTARLMGRN